MNLQCVRSAGVHQYRGRRKGQGVGEQAKASTSEGKFHVGESEAGQHEVHIVCFLLPLRLWRITGLYMLFSTDNTHTYKHIDNSGLHSKSEFLG